MTQWWLYSFLCPQSGDYIWRFRRPRSLKRGWICWLTNLVQIDGCHLMALSPCFISPESSSQDTSKILHNQHLVTFLVQNQVWTYYLAYSWFVFESTRKREALGGKDSDFPEFSSKIQQEKVETCQRWQVFEPGSWSAQSTCPCWSSLGRWTWEGEK